MNLNLRQIFRIPYGYNETTGLISKKVTVFDSLIEYVEKIIKELNAKFTKEINLLKKKDVEHDNSIIIIESKIDKILKEKADCDGGTYTYIE